MSSINVNSRPRSCKIYELDDFEKLLQGVNVAACMLSEPQQAAVDEDSVMRRVDALTLHGPRGGHQCSCCGAGPFESRAQQTAHYKHHWHTYNIKRKLYGKSTLTLTEFNNRQDDNSSLSSSESDVEDHGPESDLFAAATRHCKAFYTNAKGQVFCVYRCLLHHKKDILSTDGQGRAWVKACESLSKPGALRWAVLMLSGGRFAGAIYSGGTAVLHKTLHSYVVRRGQGQAQGTKDAQGNASKSAGASLRRYNAAQFAQHVQDVLTSWADDLAGCSLVIYRAVGPTNQGVIFGKGSPLIKEDRRLRRIPFPTRKPTFKEIQRSHDVVSSVDVYETLESFQKALIASGGNKPVTDNTAADRAVGRKTPKNSPKTISRAKSREPVARPLPTDFSVSSEDEQPRCMESVTLPNWTKTLLQQGGRDLENVLRKDIEDDGQAFANSSSSEDEDGDGNAENRSSKVQRKKKSTKKSSNGNDSKLPKKVVVKVPDNIKKMWKLVSQGDIPVLETMVEKWDGPVALCDACNVADPVDGNTALHKAAIASNPEIVRVILINGGDPCKRNLQQQTPYVATAHQDTRIAFRLFQGEYPDKFNYSKAHIPGPLTDELLQQEREKKALQKKAKRQREKEKQIEKTKSNKFLEMTDTQKISTANENRCFMCGSHIKKDPFKYNEYKFCGIKCLQNHRNLRPLNMST